MAETVLGWLTMILAVAMVVIALPQQILKNHLEQRVGNTAWLAWLPLSVYAARAAYAALIESWYIFIPDFLGMIFSAVLVYQLLFSPRLKFLERFTR